MKRLQQVGNSLGIIIDKPILDLLKMNRDTEIEFKVVDGNLLICPIRKPRRQRVHEAMKDIMDEHDATFRKLAK
jgi:antitoxin component of MazEF toxin-antitoxin module